MPFFSAFGRAVLAPGTFGYDIRNAAPVPQKGARAAGAKRRRGSLVSFKKTGQGPGQARGDSKAVMNDPQALKERLEALRLEHRDLDDVIRRLTENDRHDRLQLQRLKKRKLLLKDQISAIENLLIPDIIA